MSRIKIKNNYNRYTLIYVDPFFSTGVELFDHIASCLAEFVDEQSLHDETLPLGFTFSFPCQQEGLAKVRNLSLIAKIK